MQVKRDIVIFGAIEAEDLGYAIIRQLQTLDQAAKHNVKAVSMCSTNFAECCSHRYLTDLHNKYAQLKRLGSQLLSIASPSSASCQEAMKRAKAVIFIGGSG